MFSPRRPPTADRRAAAAWGPLAAALSARLHRAVRGALGAAGAVLFALCLFAAAGGASASADSTPTLRLDGRQDTVWAWPWVTVRGDPTLALTLDEVLRDPAAFRPPGTPEANLGPRRDAAWLRLPLQATGGDGRWVLDIDYPPLNQVDLYQRCGERTLAHHRLGAALAFGDRPLPTRTPAVVLQLPPGQDCELLLRVQTQSAMLVPIRLSTPARFQLAESRSELVQGLLAGLALALLAYSLGHWFSLREPLFGWYALMVLGQGSFFMHLYGIVGQHVLAEMTGPLAMLSPLAVLVAMLGGSRFVSAALDTRHHEPRLHQGMALLAATAVGAVLLALAGLLQYRALQVVATVLGPLLMALAVPAAYSAARRGEPAGPTMLVGWTAYALGALAMAGLLRGWLPVNPVTQHLFEAGWVVEILAWMRVLGLHIEQVRRNAERSEGEKRTLERLAATDALTGLPNRRGLQAALAQALPQAHEGHALALFMADLDGFKPVNDALGHDVGDALLVQVGQRLKAALRSTDVVARLGGDEFVVLVAGLPGEAEALAIGRKLLDAFRQPFDIDGRPCRVGLTIGLALAPLDSRDATALLKLADEGLYCGKHAGRHCIRRGHAAAGLAPA